MKTAVLKFVPRPVLRVFLGIAVALGFAGCVMQPASRYAREDVYLVYDGGPVVQWRDVRNESHGDQWVKFDANSTDVINWHGEYSIVYR